MRISYTNVRYGKFREFQFQRYISWIDQQSQGPRHSTPLFFNKSRTFSSPQLYQESHTELTDGSERQKNNEKIRATKRKKKLNERDREYNGALLCSGLSAVKQCRLPDSVNNPCSEHGDATLDKTVETPRRLALQRSRIPSRIFSFQSDGKKKGRTVVRSPREEEE